MNTSESLRRLADVMRRYGGPPPVELLDQAADTIDALTRELTEAGAGDDRLEREQAADAIVNAEKLTAALGLLRRWERALPSTPVSGDLWSDTRRFLAAVEKK